jgi:hypothetical protein
MKTLTYKFTSTDEMHPFLERPKTQNVEKEKNSPIRPIVNTEIESK